MDDPAPVPQARAGLQTLASEVPLGWRRRPRVAGRAGSGRCWSSELRTLGFWMMGFGILVGLCFPFFLVTMRIATPSAAWSVQARAGCLLAGIMVGGVNYLLGRVVFGGRLRQNDARYRALIDQSSDLVLVTDRTGHASFLSPSAERLLTPPRIDSATAHIPTDVGPIDFIANVEPQDQEGLMAALQAAIPGRGTVVEVHVAGGRGVRTLDVSVEDLTDEPSVGGLVLTAHDVTDRIALQREMVHRAVHDPLTGLPNRTLLTDRCGQALRADARMGTRAGLLLLGLDRFKEINGTLGHHYGDELLTQVGARLTGVLRGVDTVARLGGDEFAVLLPDVGTVANAKAVAAMLRAALEKPFHLEGVDLDIEASIGVVLSGEHGLDATTLLQRVDVAMHEAKTQNLGVFTYDPALDGYSPAKLALLGDLRRALDRSELVLYYQPQVNISTGDIDGVEALVRWQHPDRGLVLPDEFIPLAEHTGLIGPITRQVLDTALAQARAWSDAGRPLTISVNLAARNLLDKGLPDQVAELLVAHGVAPKLLALEVTETAIMTDPVQAQQVLERLATLGIRISIDDFGVGYTSLGQLKNLPVSEIKIDKSFVMMMTQDPSNALIVRGIVDLGHNLGFTLVAEGVESEQILTALAGLGCDIAQGYHFSRPVTAAAFDLWHAGEHYKLADNPTSVDIFPLARRVGNWRHLSVPGGAFADP